ncbi:unnamed protein product, partial [Ilex paraguariensis]
MPVALNVDGKSRSGGVVDVDVREVNIGETMDVGEIRIQEGDGEVAQMAYIKSGATQASRAEGNGTQALGIEVGASQFMNAEMEAQGVPMAGGSAIRGGTFLREDEALGASFGEELIGMRASTEEHAPGAPLGEVLEAPLGTKYDQAGTPCAGCGLSGLGLIGLLSLGKPDVVE